MIAAYTALLFIVIFIVNYYRTNIKHLLQYNVALYMLALAPTTKLFGIYSTSFYNLQFARYLSLIMIPFALIYYVRNKTICRYADKIFVTIFFLILFMLISTFLREGVIQGTYILNIEIFTVVLLYTLFIFTRFPNRAKEMTKNFLLIITFLAATLALGTYLHLEPFYTVHRLFYNTYIGSTSLETLFDFVLMYNRPHSIFSGANQFSLLASIAMIFGYYFYRIKILSRKEFVVLFIASVIIVATSGSRTGLLLYLLSLFIIYLRMGATYKIIALPFVLFAFVGIMFVASDRILNTFSSIGTIIESFKDQRLQFWLISWDYVSSDVFNLLIGYKEKIIIENEGTHFESGYLQLLGTGGLISLFCFLYLLKSFYMLKFAGEEKILRSSVLIFFIAEMMMGVFFELKWSIINGILVAYMIFMSYTSVCEKYHRNENVSNT